MSTCEKYHVTLSCLPEADCSQRKSNDERACVNCYTSFAATSENAVEDALHRHLHECLGRPGLCELSVAVEVIDANLLD